MISLIDTKVCQRKRSNFKALDLACLLGSRLACRVPPDTVLKILITVSTASVWRLGDFWCIFSSTSSGCQPVCKHWKWCQAAKIIFFPPKFCLFISKLEFLSEKCSADSWSLLRPSDVLYFLLYEYRGGPITGKFWPATGKYKYVLLQASAVITRLCSFKCSPPQNDRRVAWLTYARLEVSDFTRSPVPIL